MYFYYLIDANVFELWTLDYESFYIEGLEGDTILEGGEWYKSPHYLVTIPTSAVGQLTESDNTNEKDYERALNMLEEMLNKLHDLRPAHTVLKFGWSIDGAVYLYENAWNRNMLIVNASASGSAIHVGP